MAEFRNDMLVKLVKHMGDDAWIADVARVSTKGYIDQHILEDRNEKADERLICRLLFDRHGSPFEHVVFSFYIECPIFVAREFFRHRIASYNEESGRYRELKGVYYMPAHDRHITQTGKPADYTYGPGSIEQIAALHTAVITTAGSADEEYRKLLEMGVSREMSRIVLPQNLYTSFYVTMNARALMNFLSLRKAEPTSYFRTNPMQEIERVANKMSMAVSDIIPHTMQAFEDARYVAP